MRTSLPWCRIMERRIKTLGTLERLLSGEAKPFHTQTGELLFEQGYRAERLFMITEGVVALARTDSLVSTLSEPFILEFDSGPCYLGASEILVRSKYNESGYSITRCKGSSVSRTKFLAVIESNPSLLTELYADCITRLHRRSIYFSELARMSPRQRLKRLLSRLLKLSLARKQQPNVSGYMEKKLGGKNIRISIPIKKVQIAAALAITPAHLSRLLSDFEKDGLILRNKGWIFVVESRFRDDILPEEESHLDRIVL